MVVEFETGSRKKMVVEKMPIQFSGRHRARFPGRGQWFALDFSPESALGDGPAI